jgi:2-dehydro-3-deoxyphosphogluconate aldolase / (4S)-4-hydroxy-2-oxoglutarate aldolase
MTAHTQMLLARLDRILAQAPVMPVISIEQLEDAIPLARALVAGGLKVLEMTLRTPVALGAIAQIAEHVPEAIVGAGTVLGVEALHAVIQAGAQFAISPGATPELLQAGNNAAIPLLPGVATASEIMLGLNAGYQRFKFFPAEAAGGIAMLKSFAGPFAHVHFCPTGGIDLKKAPEYLKLPNVITIGGSWMVPAALIQAKDWAGVTALAREAAALRA